MENSRHLITRVSLVAFSFSLLLSSAHGAIIVSEAGIDLVTSIGFTDEESSTGLGSTPLLVPPVSLEHDDSDEDATNHILIAGALNAGTGSGTSWHEGSFVRESSLVYSFRTMAVVRLQSDTPATLVTRGGIAPQTDNFGMTLVVRVGDDGSTPSLEAFDFEGPILEYSHPMEAGTDHRFELELQHSSTGGASGLFSRATWIWGLGALPGSSADNPLLPAEVDGETFIFPVPVATGETVFIDPVVAVGYDYSTSDINFASVLVPAVLPNGDGVFELVVDNQSYELLAGIPFDLTTLDVAGFSEFSILGIDTIEMLDPNDPAAFVTGLTFVASGATEVQMTPLELNLAIPEPSTFALAALGLVSLHRRRRRSCHC